MKQFTILIETKERKFDNWFAKHNDKIRKEAVKEFAEWLAYKSDYVEIDYGTFGCFRSSSEVCWEPIDEVLAEYEKKVGV